MLSTYKKLNKLRNFRLYSNLTSPDVIYSDQSLIVVKKPHFIHSAPINKNQTKKDITLVDLVTEKFPDILNVKGRKENEYGLIHRLDYLTSGLVLFARNQNSFDNLLNNKITKYYLVKSSLSKENEYNYPQTHSKESWDYVMKYLKGNILDIDETLLRFIIKSKFRSYGPKGQEVRVLIGEIKQKSKFKYTKNEYITDGMIIEKKESSILSCVKIESGFRHQIRAHMNYIGLPIINDPIYGNKYDSDHNEMGLNAIALSFRHPENNEMINIIDDNYKDIINMRLKISFSR